MRRDGGGAIVAGVADDGRVLCREMKPVTRKFAAWIRQPFGLLVLALLMRPVRAGEPASAAAPHPPLTVQRLVLDLGSGSLATRDAAERELLDRGPTILPTLAAAARGAVGEAAFRLRGIVRELEEQAASRAADAAAPIVAVTGVEPAGTRAVRLRLRVGWPAGAPPLVVTLPLKSIVAEGANGEAMPPTQPAAVIEAAIPASRDWLELPVTLNAADPPLQSLRLLRGTLQVCLAGMEHDFRISDLGRRPLETRGPPVDRLGRAEVSLDDVAVRGARLLLTASVAYDTATEALASHRDWLSERPLDVVGADGTAAVRLRQTVERRSDRGLTTQAEFDWPAGTAASLRGATMRWRLPIAILELPVDFMIRDIALPAASTP